jgi:hypothetical protein
MVSNFQHCPLGYVVWYHAAVAILTWIFGGSEQIFGVFHPVTKALSLLTLPILFSMMFFPLFTLTMMKSNKSRTLNSMYAFLASLGLSITQWLCIFPLVQ